jgi:hypothetical protein
VDAPAPSGTSLDHDRHSWIRVRPFHVPAQKVILDDARSDRISRLTAREAWQSEVAIGSAGGRIAFFVLAQGAAASFISVAEAMSVPRASLVAVLVAGGFGAAVGATMGVVIGTAVAALGRSTRLGKVAFALYAFAGAVVLADRMGIIAALWGRARPLAVSALGATLASVVALVVLLFGFVRGTPAARGWLEKADPRLSSGSLFALGLLALYCGRTVVPAYYREAQNVGAFRGVVLLGIGQHFGG